MQTAVYYFPNWHIDPRNEARHGPGWTEWELLKCARPRFPGHQQPKVPLWGYTDEADPSEMARKIDLASDHGINAFIFDWYWYDGPFLQRALDEGFLNAPNRDRLQFALMWANHDWADRHPSGRNTTECPVLYPWSATKENVGDVWDIIIEKYMTLPGYWRVDGLPYFSIYATNRFIQQMGGVNATAEVLELLRQKARRAGLPGVHINGIWFDNLEASPICVCDQREWAEKIGFTSYTSYNGMPTNFARLNFPVVDYDDCLGRYLKSARHAMETLPAPYYPCITTGWDSSPRTIQSEIYEPGGYPYRPVMERSPQNFRKALEHTCALLRDVPEKDRILFINAWNEWTEGSYLEPDVKDGFSLLEILKEHLEEQER